MSIFEVGRGIQAQDLVGRKLPFQGKGSHLSWQVERTFLSWVLMPANSEPFGSSPDSSQTIMPRRPRQLA